MAKKLDPNIIDFLVEKTGLKRSTIQSKVSRIRKDNPSITRNAAAHLIALERKTTVLQKLDDEDRESLKGINAGFNIQSIQKPLKRAKREVLKPIVDYETKDYFKKNHIVELSKAYRSGCYTAVFILFRKIIENLILDLLRFKYPKKTEFYYDSMKKRNHDFSIILENIYRSRNDFDIDSRKAIERLHQIVKPFKKDSNDKVHSWFHIVNTPNEVEINKLQLIIELIKKIENNIGLQR